MIFTIDHNFIKMFGLHMINFSVLNIQQMEPLTVLSFLLIHLTIDVRLFVNLNLKKYYLFKIKLRY